MSEMKRILSLILVLVITVAVLPTMVSAAVVNKNVAKDSTVTLYQSDGGGTVYEHAGYEGSKMIDGDLSTFMLGKRIARYSNGLAGCSTHLTVVDLGEERDITKLNLTFASTAEITAAAEQLGYSSYINASNVNTAGVVVLSKTAPVISEFSGVEYSGSGLKLYGGSSFKSQNTLNVSSEEAYRYIGIFVPHSYGMAISELEVMANVEIADDYAIDMHFSSSGEPTGDVAETFGSADLYFTGRIKNESSALNAITIIAGYSEGNLKYVDYYHDVVNASSFLNLSIPIYKKIGIDSIKGYSWKNDIKPIAGTATVNRVVTEYDPLFDGTITEMQPTVYNAKSVLDAYNATAETDLPTTGISGFDNVDTIFYDGIKYKGETKKVWAYVAIPEGASAQNPVPGIVLVHGGGGTAYDLWAKSWADKGYAAISIDTEGRMPVSTNTFSSSGRTFTTFGHQNNASYSDFIASDASHSDMWFYQAACDAILAGNVLRGYDEVDSSRIGITGISYGSLITMTAIGADNRFKFAVPVYGCGHLWEGPTYFAYKMTEARKSWDPSRFYMQSGDMPILWFVTNRDQNFSLDCISASYLDVFDKANLCIVDNFSHSEAYGSIICATPNWGITQAGIEQISNAMIEFVRSSFGEEDAVGLAKISRLAVNGKNITATVDLPEGVSADGGQATLKYITYENYSDCYSTINENTTYWLPGGDGTSNSYNYPWPSADATVNGTTISVTAPDNATYCYIEYTDSRNMYTSSEMVKLN